MKHDDREADGFTCESPDGAKSVAPDYWVEPVRAPLHPVSGHRPRCANHNTHDYAGRSFFQAAVPRHGRKGQILVG